jgi:uncharacterized membrane protein
MSIPIRFPIGLLLAMSLCACGRSEPPAISFSAEVMPILQSRCGECHAPGQPGYEASGLSFVDYDSVMAGTRFGPVVVAGDSFGSTLVVLVEGRADPAIAMPHGEKDKLLASEVTTLRAWIDQGAQNN